MKKERRRLLSEIIFVLALLAFIIYSFYAFMRDNNKRVTEQNDSFIREATVQTAVRLNELFERAQSNVELMAHLYSSVMTEPVIDTDTLKDMTDRSLFDYVEFISPDGQDLAADGSTADLSDREYFQEGMKGNSGKYVVYNSRITNETLLIFYTPFYYNGEIIGVLSGILNTDTLDTLFETDYFDIKGSCYLLNREGNVLLDSTGEINGTYNLADRLLERGRLTDEQSEKFQKAIQEGTSFNFNYTGSAGSGSAYVTSLSDGDWMLVQSFPSVITKDMARRANTAGIRLVIKLVIAFMLYLIYLLVKNWLDRKQLITENQEISRIADAVPQLFTRFAIVNFEDNTYQYVEDKKSEAPESGAYTDLIAFLDSRYVGDESGLKMSHAISKEYVQEHLTEDVPYLRFEYQIDMQGRRWENMSIICLKRNDDGIPVHVLYAIQDVTAVKEREMEIRLALKSATEAAEAANRAKSDFLARMSHDIRTPMNAIMGMTAVAAMHMDDRERLTDSLSKITISSRHLLALINDVLDMSKIESGKVTLSEEPFNMADMVESIVTIIRQQVNSKHQQLRVHISDIQHEDVIGDTLRLRQIFVNILGNAVKFTPEEGIITFSIRECESHVFGMSCFEFICEDTGIGMDDEFLKTIFDPFSRSQDSASRKEEGTGLGMSITRNIIRMMNGDIQVESRLGEGSKFTVQIHLKQQDIETEDLQELADMKILVADDDEDSCIGTCEILTDIGIISEWVLSGDEAISRTVRAHEENNDFSAVILDWKMPGKDGLETAREIRSKVGDNIPIIILSAYDWTDIEAEAREAGIQAFIEKPLFRSRLVYALKSVLDQGDQESKMDIADKEKTPSYEGKRILLVEDNEINREIANELLSYLNVTVEQAENGREALDKITVTPANYYDLIFMDIQMPVMNGYDATRRIRNLGREDTQKIPIIAMTANAFADDIKESLASGMNDHIAKPVELSKLAEALEKWL